MGRESRTDEVEQREPHRTATSVGRRYRWGVVGLLWFCGFFNYADRQAVFSVFPVLEREFGLSNFDKGAIGSSFMVVYALAAPFAGFVVDRASRRRLILWGLGFWSLICAGTATAGRFWHLLVFRAAEGLGESIYFPASMSLLADYHSPSTRSRAMSLHQTSVYAGTALGGVLAGFLGQRYGWRSPFWVLGLAGMAFVPVLAALLIEPKRTVADNLTASADEAAVLDRPSMALGVLAVVSRPAAALLLLVFVGANFVAAALLTWLPDFVYNKFHLDLLRSSAVATGIMPAANAVGVLAGGALADVVARRRAGGRVRVQAAGLLLGAPFAYAVGTTSSLSLLAVALVGIGVCKGIYDANIFAALYDVVPPEFRGTAAGLMNTVGWTGGLLAPISVGLASDRFGLSHTIAATAGVYAIAGVTALVAAVLAAGTRTSSSRPT
jgi:MFS family permease